MHDSAIRLTLEDPFNAVCGQLIAELSAELGARYGDDGMGDFTPADAAVPRAAFVVAWLRDEPVGCGALRPTETETVAEIKRMYVRPWTRRRGISRRILLKLEELAREFGYSRVKLETGILQPEAIGLYKSNDYQRAAPFGSYQDDPLSVYFEKIL